MKLFFLKFYKVFFSVLLIILLIIFYYSSGYFFIINNDAYIDADWVKVASSVSGPVDKIGVKDNQKINKGDFLLGVLQEPFLIAVNSAQANLEKAQAASLILNQQIDAARDQIKANQSRLDLANLDLERYGKLLKSQVVSQQLYDQKLSSAQVASDQLLQSQNLARSLKAELAQNRANIDIAQSNLDQANYDLNHSVIKAPFDGFVNNLKIYSGDYISQGQVLFSLINTQTFRVVANIKESNLIKLKPGQKVWIYISTSPWHLYPGVIESLGRGVAREPSSSTNSNTGLPYINPVTDWIRYDYKIPVRIKFLDNLNNLNNLNLYLGTDVKVFIFV